MRIILGFLSASMWLLVLLSGMYWSVSTDVSTDGWVGMLFLLMLSLSLACSGALLLLWAGHFERLRMPGWVLVGCAVLFWLGDGLVAGVLMVVPSLGYAAWAGWKSFAEFMAQTPEPPVPTQEREH